MNGRNQRGQFTRGSKTAAVLGHRGGRITYQRHGREHMAAIGAKGYAALVQKYTQAGADRILAEGRALGADRSWQRQTSAMGDYLEEMGGRRGWRP